MADTIKPRFAQKPEFADNDPFAELTRIIGLEPRATSAQPSDANVSTGQVDDDLTLDLEQELLGQLDSLDLADQSDMHDIAPQTRGYQAPANDRGDASAVTDPVVGMDQDFDQALADFDFDTDFGSSLESELSLLADTFDHPESFASPAESQPSVPDTGATDFRQGSSTAAASHHDEVEFDDIDMDFSAQDFSADSEPLPQAPFSAAAAYPSEPYRAAELHASDDTPRAPEAAERPTYAAEPTGEEDDPFGASMEDELAALLATPAIERPTFADPVQSESWEREAEPQAWDDAAEPSAPDEAEEASSWDLEPEAGEAADAEAPEAVAADHSALSPYAAAPAAAAVAARAWLRPYGEQTASTTPETFVSQPVQPYDVSSAPADGAREDWAVADEPVVAGEESGSWDAPAATAHEDLPDADYRADTAEADSPAYDPFAQLAAMARAPLAPIAAAAAAEHVEPVGADFDHGDRSNASRSTDADETGAAVYAAEPAEPELSDDDFVFDLDTVDVPEQTIAVADDLQLPDIAYEPEPSKGQAFDDLDEDFSALISDLAPTEASAPSYAAGGAREASVERSAALDEDAFDLSDFEALEEAPIEVRPYDYAAAGVAAGAAGMAASRAYGTDHAAPGQLARGEAASNAPDGDFLFEDDFLDEDPAATAPPVAAARRSNRGMVIAGAVAAVALVGAAGAYFMSSGGGSDAPVLVRADPEPVKVRPENPGGTTVPNQNNEVYQRVSSGPTQAAPAQEQLVSTAEEPIDLASQTAPVLPPPEEALQAAKGEERVEPSAAEDDPVADEIAAVAPKKVRTMIVRADGRMVPREVEPEPQPAAAAQVSEPAGVDEVAALAPPSGEAVRQAEPNVATPAAGSAAPASSATPGVPNEPALAPAAEGEQVAAATPQDATASAAANVADPATPARGPVVPSRPADQPVDIVGEVRRDQVASAEPASATAGASGWAIQIASQPTPEGAQSTYDDLARRYGGVIGGRGVNIVRADIEGRGTFYRVRVPAASRSEALTLCTRYKAAGGSCFVSQ